MRKQMVQFVACLSMIAMLALLCEQAYAADKGGLTGKVLSVEGKPMPSFTVKLVKDVPQSMGRPGRGAKGKSAGPDTGAVGLQGGTKVIATTSTDAQGKFTFNNIDVGDYRIEGGSANIGWLYVDVKIETGKINDVGDQKLWKG